MRLFNTLLAAALLGSANIASASTLIVSGDGNIANSANTSSSISSATFNADNAQFFENILGDGSNVIIINDKNSEGLSAGQFDEDSRSVYDALGGITTTVAAEGTAISSALLSGIDLFIQFGAVDAFASAEASALSSFLTGGGTVFLLGDNAASSTDNGFINDLLSSLGSGMSIVNDSIDAGFNVSTNVLSDPLTAGMTDISYASTSSVSGGTGLLQTRDGTTFVAAEVAAPPAVPLPASGLLLLGALGGMFAARRKA